MSSPRKSLKTEELIRLIAADAKAPAREVGPALGLAWAAGLLASLALFLATLGFRDDLGDQLANWRFVAKVCIVWTAVGIGVWDCLRLSRPTETAPLSRLNWIVLGLLSLALALECTTLPPAEWSRNLVGENWPYCLTYVPLLALAPLLAVFLAFRAAAPASPWAAGAALGRLSAATGAGLYALHCPDDSPFFVLTWYGIAAALVTAIAAMAGSRLLRW